MISDHFSPKGMKTLTIPTERPAVANADLTSNNESIKLYPFRKRIGVENDTKAKARTGIVKLKRTSTSAIILSLTLNSSVEGKDLAWLNSGYALVKRTCFQCWMQKKAPNYVHPQFRSTCG